MFCDGKTRRILVDTSEMFAKTFPQSAPSLADVNGRAAKAGDAVNQTRRTSIHYKATDTHSYLHYDSSHPRHCKESLPCSQLLRLRRICSDQADFLDKAQEMASFFERRGYSAQTLKHDLEKMKHLSQSDALSKCNSTEEKMSRIPLVLTYHPLNTRVQRILLDNFKVIADDPATSLIFPQPPIVAFRRDDNLRTALVHTAEKQAAIAQVPIRVNTHVVVLVVIFPAKQIFWDQRIA